MNLCSKTLLIIAAGLLAGCASDKTRSSRDVSASDTCAPDQTLVCEVSNTGRIKHGSFSKDGEKDSAR
jgi:hypothetical protein